MTFDEMKLDIVKACRSAKARGMDIIAGSFGDGRHWGCPLTALALSHEDDPFFDPYHGYLKISAITQYATHRYGWSWWGPISFYRGFDMASKQDMGGEEINPEIFELGRAVRAEVLP